MCVCVCVCVRVCVCVCVHVCAWAGYYPGTQCAHQYRTTPGQWPYTHPSCCTAATSIYFPLISLIFFFYLLLFPSQPRPRHFWGAQGLSLHRSSGE